MILKTTLFSQEIRGTCFPSISHLFCIQNSSKKSQPFDLLGSEVSKIIENRGRNPKNLRNRGSRPIVFVPPWAVLFSYGRPPGRGEGEEILLLRAEIQPPFDQVDMVKYPVVYRVLYIPRVVQLLNIPLFTGFYTSHRWFSC